MPSSVSSKSLLFFSVSFVLLCIHVHTTSITSFARFDGWTHFGFQARTETQDCVCENCVLLVTKA